MNRLNVGLCQPDSRGAAEVPSQRRTPLECSGSMKSPEGATVVSRDAALSPLRGLLRWFVFLQGLSPPTTCYRRFATAGLSKAFCRLSYSLSLHTCFAACLVQPVLLAQTERPKASFAQVLVDADIELKSFSEMSSGAPSISTEQYEVAEQILYWLDRFDLANRSHFLLPTKEAAAREASDFTGELLSVRGRAVSLENVNIDHEDSPAQLHVLQLKVEALEKTVKVLSKQVPSRWPAGPLNEPVALQGVILSARKDNGPTRLVVLTDHIAWFPEEKVPAGWLELARLGYDVALLDEVRHGQPFVDERISGEANAFRAMLAAVSKADYRKLLETASNEVTARRATWQNEAMRLNTQWKNAAKAKPIDAANLKRQRGIALAAVERAEKGLSSVAPLFLQPEQETGQLVLLEGIARRAVRVAAREGSSEQDYFEVEFFPTDSQNLPIVCCVPEIPQGFPTGDRIRASVRVAGFFFKKWRYQSRMSGNLEAAASTKKAAFAPLVVAPTVTWMQTQPEEAAGIWSVAAGGAILVGLLSLSFWVIWVENQGRIARRRPRRYDEGPSANR